MNGTRSAGAAWVALFLLSVFGPVADPSARAQEPEPAPAPEPKQDVYGATPDELQPFRAAGEPDFRFFQTTPTPRS